MRDSEKRPCDVPGCTRTDLRGPLGVKIHKIREHEGRNWSTRRIRDREAVGDKA